MLPSISIDDDVSRHCSLVAFAEVLDQFNGIGNYSGTAVGMHLQKFWINFFESSVMMSTERHFGRPDGVKLALEPHSEQPCGAKLALERRFGSPGGVKLALERRLGGQIASSWPWNGVRGSLVAPS